MNGIELCRQFYAEAIRPILNQHFPGLAHAAALLGSGSEVLGFDDAMSTDHHWGPRGMIFLSEADHTRLAGEIKQLLARHLPHTFAGHSTHFSEPDPNDNGVQHLEALKQGPVNHRVEILTIPGFLLDTLNFDIRQPLEPADWLTFSSQHLRTITAGAVYHDGLKTERLEIGRSGDLSDTSQSPDLPISNLQSLRTYFAWYPHDIWLYLLACGWARIGQEEHLMGRAGLVGDEVGSALIGARLVRDVMRLCFLMERVYAPYPKWFGTAFKQLACADRLYPILQEVLAARTWQERQRHLIPAYETIAQMHNCLNLTKPMPESTLHFFGRPFQVIALHGFGDRLSELISDPAIGQFAKQRPIGSIDQFSDSTDMLEDTSRRVAVRGLYQ